MATKKLDPMLAAYKKKIEAEKKKDPVGFAKRNSGPGHRDEKKK